MKKLARLLLVAAAVPLLLSQQVQATQVIWTAFGAIALKLDNSPVPDDSLIRIGFFSISDSEIQNNSTDVFFLDSKFTEFDNARVGDGAAGDTPGFWGADSGQKADPSSIFDNKRIYLWVFDAPTLNGATQHGVFSSNSNDWLFPDDDAVVDSTAIDLAQVNNIVIGSAGPVQIIPGVGELPSFKLDVIPEPTTGVLVGISLLGVLAIRRRK